MAAVEQRQSRAGDGSVHLPGHRDGRDAVSAPVHDQRGLGDLAQPAGAVEPASGLELRVEGITRLRVLAAQAGQPRKGHAGPDPPAARGRARPGGDEHQVIDEFRVVQRQRHGDATAHRDAEHVSARHANPGKQPGDVGGHLLDRVGSGRLRRPARPPVVHGDDPVPGGQRLDQRPHLRHRQAQAADDHQRVARAVRFVIQLDVVDLEQRHAGHPRPLRAFPRRSWCRPVPAPRTVAAVSTPASSGSPAG